MSDYSNTFGGAAKDAAESTILGADFDTEFDAMATASATKTNKIGSPTNNNPVVMDATGDLKDGLTQLIDLLHPVGSIYTSTIATNPGTLFGVGTWVATGVGQVLIGVGTSDATYALDDTGGESTTDTSHTHSVSIATSTGGAAFDVQNNTSGALLLSTSSHTHTVSGNTGSANQTETNLPPYLVVHMWERTV